MSPWPRCRRLETSPRAYAQGVTPDPSRRRTTGQDSSPRDRLPRPPVHLPSSHPARSIEHVYGADPVPGGPVPGDPLSGDLSDAELEGELCTQAAHITVAECRLVLLVAELDRRGTWAAQGLRSCAHWLNWRCGVSLGAAREQVRVGRALGERPELCRAFSSGEPALPGGALGAAGRR